MLVTREFLSGCEVDDCKPVEVTIDDPKTYTRPWTMVLQLTQPPGFRIFPYECHEGNLGLRNIVSAERAAEGEQ